jgi:hypothetical protein
VVVDCQTHDGTRPAARAETDGQKTGIVSNFRILPDGHMTWEARPTPSPHEKKKRQKQLSDRAASQTKGIMCSVSWVYSVFVCRGWMKWCEAVDQQHRAIYNVSHVSRWAGSGNLRRCYRTVENRQRQSSARTPRTVRSRVRVGLRVWCVYESRKDGSCRVKRRRVAERKEPNQRR